MATSTFTNNISLTKKPLKQLADALQNSTPVTQTMATRETYRVANKSDIEALVKLIKHV